ncbi:MAG: hypothetical protein C0506_10345 [Anaerolinea sp.]|nr:hypothetical protein [Anaerolinea sp.]
MTVLCAWCGKLLKPGSEVVSHGICEHCSWQVERTLAKDMFRSRAIPRRRRPALAASARLPGFDEHVAV